MSRTNNRMNPEFKAPERRLFRSLRRYNFPSRYMRSAKMVFAMVGFIVLCSVFVPWQQTSRGSGEVIAYDPNERAHPITSLVSGRIKKWYVNDGEFVQKGDRIVEIIDNDPQFADRLKQQLEAVQREFDANIRVANTAKLNYDRQKSLFNEGLSARKDYEKAKIEYEKLVAKVNESSAKLRDIEIKSSQQSTQLITAASAGTITHLIPGGLSTRVKTGDVIATFVPVLEHPAVVMFIEPNDMQLVHENRKVRLQFEGWPSVQFSGWPSVAIGTFGGLVRSIDQHIDPTRDLLRIIVVPDPDEPEWPDSRYLRVGSRSVGTVLLNQVPLGYEIWRRLNNFPPRGDKPPPTVKVSK